MREATPSATARKVALNIVTLGAKPGMEAVLPRGIVDATAELLVASGAVPRWAVRWSRSRRMVACYETFDGLLPGQFEAFAHRKAFCERQLRNGVAKGACQVLVLGAGYDTLAYRLAPEFPGVEFFEIDHPATSRLKRKGLTKMGKRHNIHLIAADLGNRRLTDVLESTESWNQDASSVVVAEGLLMYLPESAPAELLKQCAAVTGAGSRLVFTYLGTGTDGHPTAGPWTRLVLWVLELAGEPWLWSIRPEDLGRFLEEARWTNAPELVGSPDRRGVEHLGVAVK
jgi:methyltransferase (TIGR00027 family)